MPEDPGGPAVAARPDAQVEARGSEVSNPAPHTADLKSTHLMSAHVGSKGLESQGLGSSGLRRAVLKWSGALTAGALIVVPVWMLLGNPAVLGGHPALPTLLLAAVGTGLLWAFLLINRSTLLERSSLNKQQRLTKQRQQRQQQLSVSRWHLIRGLAGRLVIVGFVAGLAWLNPFPHQPDGDTTGRIPAITRPTAPTASSQTTAPAGNTTPAGATPAVTTAEDSTSITLAPEGTATTGLVFYPGARVDAHAYQDLLRPLAAAGHLVVILKEPLGISLLDTGQARAAMDRHPEIASWAVGGHSLGGVSASSFAAANHDVSGLLLFASYPAENMTDAQGLSVLSISGSNDGLSTPDKIAASRSLLPPTTSYATVVGGVHAFFGDYGEQPGDGEPGITREQAQQQIVAESLRFMDRLKASG